MAWDTELRAVLGDYLEHDSTLAVVIALYRAIRTTPKLISGSYDDDTCKDAGQALLEHAFVLHNNPFMAMFSAQMTTVYQLAVNAYTDSFHYYGQTDDPKDSESQAENVIRQQACKNAVHEIALMAVLCERGFGFHRQRSIEMRDRLYSLKGVL